MSEVAPHLDPTPPTPPTPPSPPKVSQDPQVYGAPELKRLHPVFLRRALFLASGFALFVTGTVAGVAYLLSRQAADRDAVVVPYRELAAPPPIDQPQVPQVAIAQPSAPPTVGAPLPVPDEEAEPEQTIATQEELSQYIGEGQGDSGDSLIIAPEVEGDPAFGEFVYVEELPEAVTRVPPEYPDIARQSGIEGTVQLQALVGKDGKVKDVKVVKGIPVLDDAAVTAVKQWVFKPALTNNKPVAVWVAVPVRFSLR